MRVIHEDGTGAFHHLTSTYLYDTIGVQDCTGSRLRGHAPGRTQAVIGTKWGVGAPPRTVLVGPEGSGYLHIMIPRIHYLSDLCTDSWGRSRWVISCWVSWFDSHRRHSPRHGNGSSRAEQRKSRWQALASGRMLAVIFVRRGCGFKSRPFPWEPEVISLRYHPLLAPFIAGVEQWQLGGPISRRSRVRVPPPLLGRVGVGGLSPGTAAQNSGTRRFGNRPRGRHSSGPEGVSELWTTSPTRRCVRSSRPMRRG